MTELAGDSLPVAADALDIRQRSWIKRVLPKTMFGRSLLLIVAPLILVQMISAAVFYGRHWEAVSRRLASDVAGDIVLLIDGMKIADNDSELTQLFELASSTTEIGFSLERSGALPAPAGGGASVVEEQLRRALIQRVHRPFRIDAASDQRDLLVQIALS